MEALKPFTHKNITLKNRIVMPPMCMYQAKDGFVNLFHISHYSTRAMGGVGFVIVEATAVTPQGRITDNDLGIWSDDHIAGLKQLVDEVHRYGAKIAVQLGHAGRKAQTTALPHIAPSELNFDDTYQTPDAMTLKDIQATISAFKAAALRADQAGFDGIELHGAHGYLINEFMSPLSNLREDEYGGTLENRGRFVCELIDSISTVWPQEKWLMIRVSAEEYDPLGNHPEDVVEILRPIKNKLDLIHVSSGGVVNRRIPLKPLYQVEYAKTIRHALNKIVISVGLITTPEEVEEALQDTDLVALGRELLRNPNFVNRIFATQDADQLFSSYKRAFK
ncbi:MAG: NADPH dehydrogenase [Erysipelotrichaceae bacterium]|nr:MAG: NADPH dehydrogenase [Erysipelotrichaceae bacterium]